MGSHLGLFKIWLTCKLPDGAFVFAAWPQLLILENWIILRHLRESEWLIPLHLKIKELNRVEWFQIIKVDDRLALNLFHERSDVCLILKWEPNITLNSALIEAELEPNIGDIFLFTFFTLCSDIQRFLPIFGYQPFAIFSVIDTHISKPLLYLSQSFTSSHSNYLFICNFQENVNKSLPHGEMVILKDIPFWLSRNVNISGNDYFITIYFSLEPTYILISHFI